MHIKRDDIEINKMKNVQNGEGDMFFKDIWPKDMFPLKAGKFLRHVIIPPESTLGKHVHIAESELFYILNGCLEAQDGEKTVFLKQGDVLITQSGNSHSIKNNTCESAEMISIILYEEK